MRPRKICSSNFPTGVYYSEIPQATTEGVPTQLGKWVLPLQVQKVAKLNRTEEYVTLNYLHHLATALETSVSISRPLYYTTFDDRYYLVTSQVYGEILDKAWLHMSEKMRRICIEQVVGICKLLATRKNDQICGVGGNPGLPLKSQSTQRYILPTKCSHIARGSG